ncbi:MULTISPECIES: ABC transporter permease [unclassified Pyramidobacter]|uniref:ABC transporter permease n=1 Tax=unclassified Pyramidobacter TaxID=2632171 RepID=UPI00098F898A|nr:MULTISPECIES: ABC transporter permease [unclassified Pyramidobacter]MCI6260034.1 ABC transporter permease [Pyramidobacter sp.]OON88136.1 peptide ABC transporter permease [Pyramidobacter sp. C12-8]RKJ78992.1 ABC transporter permease [Pyramidobacter sp. CG50-2]WOL40135.1 ABC transporter permease [Pyramidobacter sp. YE332]
MGKYILRRLVMSVPVMIGVSIVAFLIMHLTPGDPALLLAGPDATIEDVQLIRDRFGLDDPLPVQYVRFVKGVFDGSLESMKYEVPAIGLIASRLKNTAVLAGAAMLLAVALGVLAGILSAVRRYSWIDYLSTSLALIGVSMPAFWLAIMLVMLFAVELGWLPAAGMGGVRHIVLPSVVLGTGSAGIIARMTRSTMMDVLRQDYVTTARAKGLTERVVVYLHALRNAMIPTVTVIGMQIGSLLTGAVLTESVFAWPGVGRLLVDSILGRDYPVVQATLLVVAFIYVGANLLVDILYAFLDPRIRYE